VQTLAAWLVARPQNAVLGLAATLLLPGLQIVSGMIMVLLVLKQGVRPALLEGLLAAAILAAASFVSGMPALRVGYVALVLWAPAVLLAFGLLRTRSLTLTLQALGLVLMGLSVYVFGVVDDLVEFARPASDFWLEMFRAGGMQDQAEMLAKQPEVLAQGLMVALLWGLWTMYALFLLIGYRLRRGLADGTPGYGMFRDVDFGKVLAIVLALMSIVGFVTGIEWLKNVAVVMMAMFWLQGLAVMHWSRDAGMLPLFVVVLVYILLFLPVLNELVLTGLAIFGYADVWFGVRRRLAANLKNRDW